jgi:hypothetical protein
MAKAKQLTFPPHIKRVIMDIAYIGADKAYDKATRKLAHNTVPHHVIAWMRLENPKRDLAAISDVDHYLEVHAAIVGIPLLGADHYERLYNELAEAAAS